MSILSLNASFLLRENGNTQGTITHNVKPIKCLVWQLKWIYEGLNKTPDNVFSWKNQASEGVEFRKKNQCVLFTVLNIACYVLGSLECDFHLYTIKSENAEKIINLNGIINIRIEIKSAPPASLKKAHSVSPLVMWKTNPIHQLQQEKGPDFPGCRSDSHSRNLLQDEGLWLRNMDVKHPAEPP